MFISCVGQLGKGVAGTMMYESVEDASRCFSAIYLRADGGQNFTLKRGHVVELLDDPGVVQALVYWVEKVGITKGTSTNVVCGRFGEGGWTGPEKIDGEQIANLLVKVTWQNCWSYNGLMLGLHDVDAGWAHACTIHAQVDTTSN